MEWLKSPPKMILLLSFSLNKKHYFQQGSACNKRALGVALIESALSQGLSIEETVVIIYWNLRDLDFGRAYCKVYVKEEDGIGVYQADIPENMVIKIQAEEAFSDSLTFDWIGHQSNSLESESVLSRLVGNIKKLATNVFSLLSR